MSTLLTAADARNAVESIAAVGVCISSLEWLTHRRPLADDGLFSWSVFSLQTRWLAAGPIARVIRTAIGYRGLLALLIARLAVGAALIATSHPQWRAYFVLFLAGSSLALRVRLPIGGDGSDQLSTLLFVALGVGYIAGTPWAMSLSLWFVAAQGALAYATAGILKLVERGWRNGEYLFRVWGTTTYGAQWINSVIRGHRWLAIVASWYVIAFEVTFPSVIVAPRPLGLAILVMGVTFHVTTAVTMGLNTFLWSFVATYPAIVWCARL
jgi:hypothetical protein